MAIVPKRNIAKTLHDIKSDKMPANIGIPAQTDVRRNRPDPTFLTGSQTKKEFKKSGLAKYIAALCAVFFLATGGLFAANAKEYVANSVSFISLQINNAKKALSEMKTGDLKNSLGALSAELRNIGEVADSYGMNELFSIIGQFNSSLKEVPGAFKNISAISEKSAQIAEDTDYLKINAFQLLFNGKGDELISRLENLEKNLSALEEISVDFKNQARKIKNLDSRLAYIYGVFDKNYLSINLNIYKAKQLAGALLSLLKSADNEKILVLFQNPTEIRPAGGFIGSFGYVTLSGGSLKEIKIDDIYNADRQLNVKIAPPQELSAITNVWGARDANWFFNFPDSARKVSYFLENSKLFSGDGTKFNNVVAINTNVLKTLIEITGPIELPAYKLTINSENFLPELQREVEAGQDKKPGQNPKRILSVLAPILTEKLKNLDEEGKAKLIIRLKEAADRKDIMAFSENEDLQKMFAEFGLSGETYNIQKDFNGDYLAAVNANVAGGKSDAFMSQQIKLASKIIEDGSLLNNLSITRTHSGQSEKDWWYKATNKDYVKIFTPLSSEITAARGADNSPYTYTASVKGAVPDVILSGVEKSLIQLKDMKIQAGEENGKNIFTGWLNVAAGKSKTLEMEYKQSKAVKIKDGAAFEFIYDKQSGVGGSLEYEITAPPGYVWEESGKPVFSYGTQEAKARETVRLTLKKVF